MDRLSREDTLEILSIARKIVPRAAGGVQWDWSSDDGR
jgi:hypothetical protein